MPTGILYRNFHSSGQKWCHKHPWVHHQVPSTCHTSPTGATTSCRIPKILLSTSRIFWIFSINVRPCINYKKGVEGKPKLKITFQRKPSCRLALLFIIIQSHILENRFHCIGNYIFHWAAIWEYMYVLSGNSKNQITCIPNIYTGLASKSSFIIEFGL